MGEVLAGRYELMTLLGRGGMGEVWRAIDKQLDAEVAIKLLDVDLAQREHYKRFHDEARAAAQIRSPHVVQVLDHGVDGKRPFIVMELLEGETLRDRLDRVQRLSPFDTFRVLQHAGRALTRAHALGIIHRDLKPENLYIVHNIDEEIIKVLDFGIAKRIKRLLTTGSGQRTGANMIMGTPSYMSPEQTEPRATVDERTDVWALGVIAFECLCGRCPFEGKTAASIIIAVARDQPPLPSSIAPVPPAFDAWFLKSCAKRPSDRFPNVANQISELRNALHIEVSDRRSLDADEWSAPRMSAPLPPPKTDERTTERMPNPEESGALPAQDPAFWNDATELAPRRPTPRRQAPPSQPAPQTQPQKKVKKRSVPWPLLAVVSVATAAIVFGVLMLRARSRVTPFEGKVPKSESPDAIAEYRAGVQSIHDASIAAGIQHLMRATEIDPSLAEAHLRLAMVEGNRSNHFGHAVEHRPTLDDHDRALLDSLAPLFHDTPAHPEQAIERARATTKRYPDDAEAWWLLAQLEVDAHDMKGALEHTDRALAADKTLALAYWTRASVYEDQGDLDAMKATLDTCLRIAPQAASCLRYRADVIAKRGDCEGFEGDARRMVALEPDGARSYEYLMRALAGRGDLSGATEALKQAVARSNRDKITLDLVGRLHLALLRGDFEAADALAAEYEKAQIDQGTSDAHVESYRAWLQIARELGDDARAADVADAYWTKRAVWVGDANWLDRKRDPAMFAASVLLGAKRIDRAEYERRRDAWSKQILPGMTMPDVWVAKHGVAIVDATDAKEALEAATPAVLATPSCWASLGKAHLAIGDTDGAIPLLRGATKTCLAFDDPVEHTRAHDDLGRALEAKGDVAGACGAYRVVLTRWGAATKSITALHAQQASKNLACP